MDKTEKKLDVLLSEYHEISKRIHEIMLHQERLLNYSILIIGAVVIYGFTKELDALSVFFPLGIFAVYFYSLYYINQIHALGGYKKFLEEELNLIIEKIDDADSKKIFLWEKYARKYFHLDINNAAQALIYIIVLGIFVSLAFISAQGLFQIIMCCFYVLLIILLIISISKSATKFNKTYNYYKNN